MANIFDDILRKGAAAGIAPAKEQSARDWYREAARQGITGKGIRFKEGSLMRDERAQLRNRPAIGRMYMFFYNAKHAATLPYWDRFPLVIPFAPKGNDGFLGMNFHYLNYQARAKLMDALYDLASTKKYNDRTKLELSYGILKSAAKYKYFKPCIKHYLFSQLRSRFLYIPPTEWDIALFLPLARFEKASASKVWADSAKIYNKK